MKVHKERITEVPKDVVITLSAQEAEKLVYYLEAQPQYPLLSVAVETRDILLRELKLSGVKCWDRSDKCQKCGK